ncbi:MAG: COX15/CtaA family protein [Gemmatimonadota bacterium]|nr:COX15/CtaA family protein [Gemmatimonadota bacterium]MDH5759076.1 COX15/CtaA family protein [Gemmatimonadota bacterium]
MDSLHPRAFTVTVVWTLVLLYLGSVVHATESSLACPDWPTCFGTLVPEMSGGVFWEHLHRLVAGGLLLMWGLATYLARKETRDRPWIFRWCLAGIVLLLVQSVFGGLTVLFKLPDLVSTSHLSLALLFLVAATVLASATGWSGVTDAEESAGVDPGLLRRAATWGSASAVLVFVQSVLGGLVRHTDAGMACPDAPLCQGAWIPPLDNGLVALHFTHRVVGVAAAVMIVAFAAWAHRTRAPHVVRSMSAWASILTLIQVALGFISVLGGLAVIPVSLHTLVAASLLVVLVHVTTAARARSTTGGA